MADSRKAKVLLDLLQRPGNETCADCGAKEPSWAAYNHGIFVCTACAGVHRKLGTDVSKTKSLTMDNWDDNQIQLMESQGNLAAKRYELHVPISYRRPGPDDPDVIREQWIRAKYERMEFMDPEKQSYLNGRREGFLYKKGRDDSNFQKRRFLLSESDGTLQYFNRDDPKAPAKCLMRIDTLNIHLVPDKVGKANSMQIIFDDKDNHTRNLFVYADTGQELIEWYTAIRSAKLNRLRIAYPGADDENLLKLLKRDFLKEGYLSKTGPKTTDSFRKRWFSLDKRKLLYYAEPLDAYPKGEIYLGSLDSGFAVREGLPPIIKDPGNSFTLITPKRKFHFAADSLEEQQAWLEVLKEVLKMPMSPQDSSSMFHFNP